MPSLVTFEVNIYLFEMISTCVKFLAICTWILGVRGSENKDLAWKVLQKTVCHRNRISADLWVHVGCRFGGQGHHSHAFA